MMRRMLVRVAVYAVVLTLAALVLFLTADYMIGRSLPDLKPWHETELKGEFRAEMLDERFGWAQWLALEERLFSELEERLPEFRRATSLEVTRYQPGGNLFARRLQRDWNRSYVLEAPRPRAVALLLHGLSDSPYSLRSLALALNRAGVTVYGLRLPGHGTVPGALDQVVWQDWLAAVRVAGRHIESAHGDLPFWVVGYSMGAALAVKYTLDAMLAGEHPAPEGLVLVSPALGVSPLARLANLQRLLSRYSYFRKSRWLDILPEYDPYKYLSFAKNGGRQMSLLISEIYAGLGRLRELGRNGELPPILAFQSVVDETVSTLDLVERLYDVVRNPRSELVLFDINRLSFFEALTRFSPEAIIESLQATGDEDYRTTVITNRSGATAEVEARSWPRMGEPPRVRALGLRWPDDVYSLSHVALPFPPDDPVYGYAARDSEGRTLTTLGNLAVRGERNVLMVPASELLRQRANPFHSWLERRVLERILGKSGDDL